MITILTYAAQWFVYKKMGRKGWESLIPIYNTYVLFEILYGSGWSFLKLLIPFYNIYILIKLNIDLAHKFNQSTGFGWGLVFLPTIFYCIMAFSKEIQCDGIEVDVIEDVKNTFSSNSSNTQAQNNSSDADVLIKYKELLDLNIITDEEFKRIKERILNI